MQFNPQIIKQDFPLFNNVPDLVYLDSATTSQTPQVVLDAMNGYYTTFRANVHRGLYKESETASEAYEGARIKVARFIGAKNPQEIIFTGGATASSNMLIAMLNHSGRLNGGDEMVTTIMEHHASLIPLQEVAERHGLVLKHIPLKENSVTLDYEEAERLITSRVKLVSVILASNVTGTINDVARIAEMAHSVGALVVCDATAVAGHLPLDVEKLGVDFLYFSGHKMCGPTGVGVLWGKKEIIETLEPGIYGGGIVDEVTPEKATWRGIPERFEAGTPNIAGVIGLGGAVDYLEKVGLSAIREHSKWLVQEAILQLSKITGVTVYAMTAEQNVGTVSFTVEGIHPHDIAEILGREHVAVRVGHHCAMPFVTALGVNATTRASFYLYNTKEDVEALARGIKKAKEVFGK